MTHLQEKVAAVKAQMRQLKQIGKQMASAPDGQISLTDPDARSKNRLRHASFLGLRLDKSAREVRREP